MKKHMPKIPSISENCISNPVSSLLDTDTSTHGHTKCTERIVNKTEQPKSMFATNPVLKVSQRNWKIITSFITVIVNLFFERRNERIELNRVRRLLGLNYCFISWDQNTKKVVLNVTYHEGLKNGVVDADNINWTFGITISFGLFIITESSVSFNKLESRFTYELS